MQPFPYPSEITHKIVSALADWLQRKRALKMVDGKAAEDDYTVKPVLSNHIKQNRFLTFQKTGAYSCMKIVHELSALLSFSNAQSHVNSDFHVT